MYLAIDIGNSRQKAALFSENGELVTLEEQRQLTSGTLVNWTDKYPVKASILSSVGEERLDLERMLERKTRYIRFSHATPLPISIDYQQPKTLGLDRIADAVAAQALFPGCNVLAIQCGTCLVMDFVNQEGRYLGGSISPGLEMRLASLHHYTHRLPEVSYRPVDFLIGDTTEKSILGGVVNGMADEIDGAIERYTQKFKELKVMMTGGNCEQLHFSIKHSIFATANAVLYGLYKILLFNEKAKP